MKVDVVVIGAGAAGLMCAIEAGKRGRQVVVLEHAERIGKKILISGGGRCNFTNQDATHEQYLSRNPHFCKSALSRYQPTDFMNLVKKHEIDYFEKKSGQLFCTNSAKQIVAMLMRESKDVGVKLLLKTKVSMVDKKDQFFIQYPQGSLQAESLVIATGGLSYSKLGASDFGYRVAKQFDHSIQGCCPALVPLNFDKEDQKKFCNLSGISLDALVSCNGKVFRENILFTHHGLSGPAILQISSYWNPGDRIEIDLFPDTDILDFLLQKRKDGERSELKNLLSQFFPRRFAEKWCQSYFVSKPLQQYTPRQLQQCAELLHHWEILPKESAGYDKAEVTRGGVDTQEISSKTMESLRVPGLYFVGEVLDVTGQLGGYNFQWAWASGFVAGQVV